MDALKELQENWTLQNYESAVQQRIWDRRAEHFSAHPLPVWDKDAFLQRMSEEVMLDRSMRTLDVGCGAGGYSIRLAERVVSPGEGGVDDEMGHALYPRTFLRRMFLSPSVYDSHFNRYGGDMTN